MSDSTFSNSDYKKLNQEEESLNRLLADEIKVARLNKPSKQSIHNILAYSKAISIRKAKSVDFIENILN